MVWVLTRHGGHRAHRSVDSRKPGMVIGRTDGRQMVVVVMSRGGGCGGRCCCRWMHHGRRWHAAAVAAAAAEVAVAGRRRWWRLASGRVRQRPDFGFGGRRGRRRWELLLVVVHVHAVLGRGGGRRVAGHLVVVVVVGIVHQIGNGDGNGNVAPVVVMGWMHQMVRMNQMVQRIAADRVGRDGAAGVVVAIALVLSIAVCRNQSMDILFYIIFLFCTTHSLGPETLPHPTR